MIDDANETTTDIPAHARHVAAPPCDECSAEMKRLAMVSAMGGMVLGLMGALIVSRLRRG